MRKLSIALVTLILTSGLAVPPANAVGTPGQGDTEFNAKFANPLSSASRTYSAASMADGSVLVGGGFSRKLARLNGDGTSTGSAATFNSNIGAALNNGVQAISVLNVGAGPDSEKIVVGGYFTGYLKMFNSDGTTGGTAGQFNSNVPNLNLNTSISSTLAMENGSLLVATNGGALRMVSPNGTLEWSASVGSFVEEMVELPDGSVIVGGAFRDQLKMIEADGTFDSETAIEFNANASVMFGRTVRAIALDAVNGTLIVGGDFEGNVKRLNLDGTISPDQENFNLEMLEKSLGAVWSVASSSNGTVIVSSDGRFVAFNLDGSEAGPAAAFNNNRPDVYRAYSLLDYPGGGYLLGGMINSGVARINADGSSTGASGIFNANADPIPNEAVISAVAHQGAILLGGGFSGGIRMINEDGSTTGAAATFNLNVVKPFGEYDPPVVVLGLRNGKVLAGGESSGLLKMLNADGTTTGAAADFNSRVPTLISGGVSSIQELADGRIVVGGYTFEGGMPRGYIKMFNSDGTTTGVGDFNTNVSVALAQVDLVTKVVALDDNSFVAAVCRVVDNSEGFRCQPIKINADGKIEGAASVFNENALGFLEQLPPSAIVQIRTVVALADGSLVFGGIVFDPDSENESGFLLKSNPDGTLSGTETELFNSNVFQLFDGAVSQITVSRDGSMIVVGEFDGYVKRLNSDGSVNGDSTDFNRVASDAGIGDNVNTAVLTSDGSVIVAGGFETLTTRNIYKFYGGGFPIVSSAAVVEPQNNSPASPSQKNAQPSPPQSTPQPSPPQVLPPLAMVPFANYTVVFSSGSKTLVGKYQSDLNNLVEKSGMQAKYTINASASMVRGVSRTSVSNLAKARAARVRSHLMKLGVRSADISIKFTVNKIGQTPSTKITVKK